MNQNGNMSEEFEKMVNRMSKLDFPLVSSKEKKKDMIEDTKDEINDQFDEIIRKYSVKEQVGEEQKKQLWERAKEHASHEFKNLPNKLKINAFYFQELMHKYVELLIETVNDI